MNLLGPASQAGGEQDVEAWRLQLLASSAHTIWGGTAQIQRNIVAERILGLPREPRRA